MSDASNESQTSPQGPRQFEVTRRIELVRFGGGGGSASPNTVRVRLITPDARLLQKLTLQAIAVGTAPPDVVLSGRGLKVWWKAMELDQVRGKQFIAVNNLLGSSQAIPNDLPEDAGLGGSSIEVVTSADAIEAEITVPAQGPGGVAGSLYAQARFQPAAFRLMPWAEWDEVRSQTQLKAITDTLVIP